MQSLTQTEAQAIAAEFGAWLDAEHIPQRAAAALAGVSQNTLGAALRGESAGNRNLPKLAQKLAKILAEHRPRPAPAAGFRPTRNAVRVLGALADAQEESKSVLVVGQHGAGKTFAAAEYAARSDRVIRLRCLAHGNVQTLLAELAHALHVRKTPGVDLLHACAAALAGMRTLLVIDEIDWASEVCLQSIRTLADLTDPTGRDVPTIGVAYLGTPAFWVALSEWPPDRAAQFTDRLAYVVRLEACDAADAASVLADAPMDAEALESAHSASLGSLRRLRHGADEALRLAGEGPVTSDHVAAGFAHLPPAAAARRSA